MLNTGRWWSKAEIGRACAHSSRVRPLIHSWVCHVWHIPTYLSSFSIKSGRCCAVSRRLPQAATALQDGSVTSHGEVSSTSRFFWVFIHWFIRIEKDSEQDTSRSEYRLWSLFNLINLWLSALHLSFGKVWAQVSQVSLVHHCTSGAPQGSTCTARNSRRENWDDPENHARKHRQNCYMVMFGTRKFCLVYPKSMCIFFHISNVWWCLDLPNFENFRISVSHTNNCCDWFAVCYCPPMGTVAYDSMTGERDITCMDGIASSFAQAWLQTERRQLNPHHGPGHLPVH